MIEKMFVDYWHAKECKEPEAMMCFKCGKCGRKFENGIMVDDGGTTSADEEELSHDIEMAEELIRKAREEDEKQGIKLKPQWNE